MGMQRRRHLEYKLGDARSDCTLRTETKGRPYTLVVTKGLDAGTRALQEWTKRHAEVQRDLLGFDGEKMKMLLGDEVWERILSMWHLRCAGQSQRGRPAASVQTAPAKQPARSRAPLDGLGSANGVRAPVAIRAPSGTLAGRKRGRGDLDDPIVLE